MNPNIISGQLVTYAALHAEKSGYKYETDCLEKLDSEIVYGLTTSYSNDPRTDEEMIRDATPNITKLNYRMFPYAEADKVVTLSIFGRVLGEIHDFFCPGFLPFC